MQILFQEGIQLLLFNREQGVDLSELRLGTEEKFGDMIPVVVLQENVKIVFGKYKLKAFGIREQRGRRGLYFHTLLSFFSQVLEGGSRDLYGFFGELREQYSYKQSVSEFLVLFISSIWSIQFLLVIFLEGGKVWSDSITWLRSLVSSVGSIPSAVYNILYTGVDIKSCGLLLSPN